MTGFFGFSSNCGEPEDFPDDDATGEAMKVTRMKFFPDGHVEELITETPAPGPDAPAARQRFPDAFAFRSACCQGEKCLRCGAPADGKIEEVIFDDDPIQMRHPFTAYLCKAHLRETLIAAFGKER